MKARFQDEAVTVFVCKRCVECIEIVSETVPFAELTSLRFVGGKGFSGLAAAAGCFLTHEALVTGLFQAVTVALQKMFVAVNDSVVFVMHPDVYREVMFQVTVKFRINTKQIEQCGDVSNCYSFASPIRTIQSETSSILLLGVNLISKY